MSPSGLIVLAVVGALAALPVLAVWKAGAAARRNRAELAAGRGQLAAWDCPADTWLPVARRAWRKAVRGALIFWTLGAGILGAFAWAGAPAGAVAALAAFLGLFPLAWLWPAGIDLRQPAVRVVVGEHGAWLGRRYHDWSASTLRPAVTFEAGSPATLVLRWSVDAGRSQSRIELVLPVPPAQEAKAERVAARVGRRP